MRLADEFVHVPGGSVLNNNVDLVVNIAVRCGVHAVWPVRRAPAQRAKGC